MSQQKRWFGPSVIGVLLMGLLVTVLAANRPDDRPVGMTLLFQSAGRAIVVERFDLDGRRGPVPGAVGGIYPRGGKEMTFMPGDNEHGIPHFVEVAWTVPTDEFDHWAIEDDQKPKGILNREQLAARRAEFQMRWAANPHHTKRVDLTSIITPELVAQVRADRHNTQLKLIIIFNNDDMGIKALSYKWR